MMAFIVKNGIDSENGGAAGAGAGAGTVVGARTSCTCLYTVSSLNLSLFGWLVGFCTITWKATFPLEEI